MVLLALTIVTFEISAEPQARFEDVTNAVDLDFVHFNGMSGKLFFVEMTGQGGAFLDFDNDGDLDIYLVQGAMLGDGKALFPPVHKPPMDRLLRNDLAVDADGKRHLRFVDVTDESGIRSTGYGMGVAAGDIDNDGWVDLYVTHYGENRLLRNKGDGTFADITAASGTGDPAWGTSAAFFDYDRDGRLDLYVANYVSYVIEENKRCYAKSSRQDYCGPSAFPPQHDRLYHNLGDGRFEEVSDALLVGYQPGAGLGVATADLNGDGWIDIYVANDGAANQLWLNQKGRSFVDDALFSGAAVNRSGKAEASMGVDAGDFDNDGDEDVFLTHLMGETNTLYVNDGKGIFDDQTVKHGLATRSFRYTAFGTAWLDYDNDSWLDLLILNGAVQLVPRLADAGDPYPLHEPNQLFRNLKGHRFEEVEYARQSPLRISEVSRGAAFGDVDNDGDTDVLVLNNNGKARLLLNRVGQLAPWLGLRLTDAGGRYDKLGASIEVLRAGSGAIRRRARSDGSYCSANDPRVLIGRGTQGKAALDVRVRWPDGGSEEFRGLAPRLYHELRQGQSNAEREQ